MEEIQPGGAIDVHGCAEHFLRERFLRSEVRGRHGEVGEGDLDVEGRGDHVRGEDECDTPRNGGDGMVEDPVAEPGPEENLPHEFEIAMPPRGTILWAETQEEVFPGEPVEVEAAEGEDGVIEVFLPWDSELRQPIVGHHALVVGGVQRR